MRRSSGCEADRSNGFGTPPLYKTVRQFDGQIRRSDTGNLPASGGEVRIAGVF